jgi:phthiocerol/phenolphthiocerol synthesis type-I polyketide synthase E
MSTGEAVAVIGMACRFPGAGNIRDYWTALRDGREGIRRYTPAELAAAGVAPELYQRADYVPARGALTGARAFDWTFFKYSRAEAAIIDPQQRIFLECASEAIDDAGLDPPRFPGRIGVYAGTDAVSGPPDDTLDPLLNAIGQRDDFLTSRVAYKLGLRGPAITVQTACSTSLTAVHLAVRGLLAQDCDVALAGGVRLAARQCGYQYREGGTVSPDGHCRPFDEHAAGTVPGEGVGIVVLQRLPDAIRSGNRIAAVIRGTAVNNDGGEKIGFTAPSVRGQRDAIESAQLVAEVDPADIDYIEAHGTATKIGDVVEIRALADAFRKTTDKTASCWIGAVKSNIGHTGAAAGVAGLIKTVLMLEHGELVPTLHYVKPNPLLNIGSTPFRVRTELGPWPDRGPRLAGVSSFGMGGANAHAIVTGPPERRRPIRPGPHVFPLSAASVTALDRMQRDLGDCLQSQTDIEPGEAARTLASRRRFRFRRAFVADGTREAVQLMRDGTAPTIADPGRRVGFLFPGQGTLGHAAGAAAYGLLPVFRSHFDEISELVSRCHAVDLSPVVARSDQAAGWFTDTVHQQLGLFALGYALGRQLSHWGIEPAAMLGNSIGEYPAATLAGLWTPQDAAGLVYERARAMGATEPGHMTAVNASLAEVTRRIGRENISLVAVIGPGRTVLAGPPQALDEVLAGGALSGLNIQPLDVQFAFHTAAMDPAAERLRAALEPVPHHPAAPLLVSTVTGDWADPDTLRAPDYWIDQLRRPVLLEDGIAALLSAGCDTYVELGPGTSMTGAMRRHSAWDPRCRAIPLLGRAEENGERSLLRALACLWELGADIDLGETPGVEPARRCSLPAHPFAAEDPRIRREEPRAGQQPGQTLAGTAPQDTAPRNTAPRETVLPPPAASRDSRGPATSVLAQLWCEALGVQSADSDDDFFALGGESLMALNLVTQVKEATAADIAVADFSEQPTFGRLVRLVADGSGQAPASEHVSRIVTLRPEGSLAPVFLAADALGTATVYRSLARHLGDRAVYGLEPAGTGSFPSVKRLAARHVAAVRQARTAGPCVIGGWSFGGIVAHEMARQLGAHGIEVGLLVLIDGSLPNGRRLPLGLDPAYLAGCLRMQFDAALGTGSMGKRLPSPALRRTFIASISKLPRYRPGPVPHPAIIVRAGAGTETTARQQRRLSPLYAQLHVTAVEGNHWSILGEPRVAVLAEKIREAMSALDVPSGAEGA